MATLDKFETGPEFQELTGVSQQSGSFILQNTGGANVWIYIGEDPAVSPRSAFRLGRCNAGSCFFNLTNTGEKVWAKSPTPSVVSITEGATSNTIGVYDSLAQPRVLSSGLTLAEVETYEGNRFYGEVDIDLTGTAYYIYRMPSASSGKVIALQKRDFKNEEGRVDIDILWDSTGIVEGASIPTFNENRNSSATATMTINEVTSIGAEGTIRERDFIASGSGFFSSSGAIASDTGFRLYSPDSFFILKITNQEAGSQRVHVSYSWYELPAEDFANL